MKIDTTKEELVKRYLLDECDEDERMSVEQRFVADDEFFDEMLAFEDELYLEYSAGELSEAERNVFDQKFLRTRQDRDRAAFAAAFLDTTGDMASERNFAAVPAAVESVGLWQSIGAFFNFGSALQFGMAAAMLLLSIGIVALLIQNSRMREQRASLQRQNEVERTEIQEQLAEKQREQRDIENQLTAERDKADASEVRLKELEAQRQKLDNEINERRRLSDRQSLSKPGGQSTIATLVISPGLFTRSDGQPMNRIVLSSDTRTLNLRLTLKNVSDYQKFGVIVNPIDGGNIVLSRSDITANGRGEKRSLTLNIPGKSLQRADYQVRLTGVTKNGVIEEITRYYFSVDK